jgi:hypothetical protein
MLAKQSSCFGFAALDGSELANLGPCLVALAHRIVLLRNGASELDTKSFQASVRIAAPQLPHLRDCLVALPAKNHDGRHGSITQRGPVYVACRGCFLMFAAVRMGRQRYRHD